MSRFLRLLAMMLGSLVVTTFLFRHTYKSLSEWIPVAVLMAVICVPFGIPSIGNAIAARPRTTFWSGIAITIMSLASIFALIFWSSFYGFPKGVTGNDPISLVIIYMLMFGIMLTMLPRGIVAQKRLAPLLTKPKTELPKGPAVGGVREGARASHESPHFETRKCLNVGVSR